MACMCLCVTLCVALCVWGDLKALTCGEFLNEDQLRNCVCELTTISMHLDNWTDFNKI